MMPVSWICWKTLWCLNLYHVGSDFQLLAEKSMNSVIRRFSPIYSLHCNKYLILSFLEHESDVLRLTWPLFQRTSLKFFTWTQSSMIHEPFFCLFNLLANVSFQFSVWLEFDLFWFTSYMNLHLVCIACQTLRNDMCHAWVKFGIID